ncbi:MAG TPA: sulfotransferase [Candidatus Limnocylindrales bacterium]|nr:sulfotransferase [Candidatus Limnocylindrales bacterium]
MPDIVFLVGMHRSGTSALTRVLSLCGGALPVRLLPPDAGNPSGYWEPLGAVDLNDAHLRARGSSWYDTRFDARPEPPDAGLVERIAEFLTTGFAGGGPLLIKEPRITLLLPAWLAAADALKMPVRIVHLVRDPFEVAASLAVRNHIGTEHALALWLKYTLTGERDARGPRRLFVAYDELLADWRSVVSRCIEDLGLSLVIAPETPAAVAEHLSPALRHHRGTLPGEPEALDPELVACARELHAVLRDAAAGAEPRGPELAALLARYAASPYAAGRDWPEPLAESAGYEPAPAARSGPRASAPTPFGLAESATDPHTAEVNRLKYQIEKQRYEREVAEREAAGELAQVRDELASALAAIDRSDELNAQLEAQQTELRTRLAAAAAAESDLHKIVAALRGKADAAAQQLYDALQRNHALAAELEVLRAAAAHHEEQLAELSARSDLDDELRRRTEQLEATVTQLREQLAAREALLDSLQRSRSWRLTAPLRRAARALGP